MMKVTNESVNKCRENGIGRPRRPCHCKKTRRRENAQKKEKKKNRKRKRIKKNKSKPESISKSKIEIIKIENNNRRPRRKETRKWQVFRLGELMDRYRVNKQMKSREVKSSETSE